VANLFDSSAVIALVRDERGADKVLASLPGGFISTVNASEVIAVLMREAAMSFEEAQQALHKLDLTPLDFTIELAELAARISSPETHARGISLGDRACLATALHAGLPIVSADRTWSRLKIAHLKIEFIR